MSTFELVAGPSPAEMKRIRYADALLDYRDYLEDELLDLLRLRLYQVHLTQAAARRLEVRQELFQEFLPR